MSKPILIEKAKNLILVVLFLSTVLLLYFFWGNLSFDDWKQPFIPAAGEVPDASYLIRPDRIIVNFGADNYTVIHEGVQDVWSDQTETGNGCMIDEIDRFGQAENIYTEEITYDQYLKAMSTSFRSIRAEFRYNIPASDFSQSFRIKNQQNFNSIETITAVGYSTASEAQNSLFLYDGKNHKYYRLVADENKAEFGPLIDNLESAGYNIYYPVSTYLGVENNALIPLMASSNLEKFPYRQEYYSYQTEKINEMAENFFGGNFDFVRKITEDKGTVIYMYGYGQTVLIVNTDGSMEYKEEQSSDDSGQSFLSALNTAVEFVANHGSWGSLSGVKMTPYLKDVILDPNKQKGYQFIFGMELNGMPVLYENGDPITVNVTKGQVTYYKRNLIDFDQKDLEEAKKNSSYQDAFSPVNLIAQNYLYIYNVLLKAELVNAAADQNAMFDRVAALVSDMRTGYLRISDDKSADLQPVWIITFDHIEIYFDLYTAEPISYSIQ